MITKASDVLISNIVKKEKMREFQLATLEELKNALIQSFGPYGSNTIISSEQLLTKYSKDGHTILKNIKFQDIIENTVKNDIEDITRNIVKKVGDGTTSAVLLSYLIFKKLIELEEGKTPYELIDEFKTCVENINKEITSHKQEFNSDMAYKISLISTNGNEKIASEIKGLYEQFGNDVFIDVAISNTDENLLKIYDGMTLETGYSDAAFINNSKKGCCSLRNPEIYFFEDPIDTPEMVVFLNQIISNNIVIPANNNKPEELIPTVVLAPKVSRDMVSYLDQVIKFMNQFKEENRPPFLFISNIYKADQYLDIARICGAKTIKKYIDPKIQKQDIEKGLAPTPETIRNFAGKADIVESDIFKTKFVNPKEMYEVSSNGERVYTQLFQSLVSSLQSELAKAYEENADANVTGNLKRRINSLKANMVEYLIGGISASDRDSLKDLVEDAVLNCRSASRHGVGYGANFEGYLASYKLSQEESEYKDMYTIIYEAYKELIRILYSTAIKDYKTVDEYVENIDKGPYNIRTKSFDGDVLCSIDTDIVILNGISKIVSLMFTSNQFLCPSIITNRYIQL